MSVFVLSLVIQELRAVLTRLPQVAAHVATLYPLSPEPYFALALCHFAAFLQISEVFGESGILLYQLRLGIHSIVDVGAPFFFRRTRSNKTIPLLITPESSSTNTNMTIPTSTPTTAATEVVGSMGYPTPYQILQTRAKCHELLGHRQVASAAYTIGLTLLSLPYSDRGCPINTTKPNPSLNNLKSHVLSLADAYTHHLAMLSHRMFAILEYVLPSLVLTFYLYYSFCLLPNINCVHAQI